MIENKDNMDDGAIIKPVSGEITVPKGFKAAGVSCGIKQSSRKDISLIVSRVPAAAAAVFTTNKMAAAPVHLSKNNIANGKASAIIINSGNANACTGEQGMKDAEAMVRITAEALNIEDQDVLVASTGIIGVPLPMIKIETGIKSAVEQLLANAGEGTDAAEAILTTDTFKKEVGLSIKFGDAYNYPTNHTESQSLSKREIKIGGMAKGSGMIEPNMATMLAFITTDAAIEPALLDNMLRKSVDKSFNSITVDGDTSTNDMVAILANGESGVSVNKENEKHFQEALDRVCIELARLIVRDGEGATKLIEIEVIGAQSKTDAKKAAKAIANSNLVKTAFFGQDANWGRVVCAAGYSTAEVESSKIDVYYEDQKMVENGRPIAANEQRIEDILKGKDIKVLVDLKLGNGSAKVWTCDFSYDYVKINAEYHT